MNYIFFLFPVLLVGFPLAFAEQTPTYDKEIIQTNPDGSQLVQIKHYLYERIHDGETYKDYIFSDIGSSLEVKTASKTVHLDKTTCGFSFYDSNNNLLFNDSIIAFQSVVDQYTWNAVTSVNNAACNAYFDEPNNSLVAKRFSAGVGMMEYKYIFDKGNLKTQLEATNLSSLTNRVFAFDQTIDINRDTIKFGGITRNLDNFNGQTFDRAFLENNKAKLLDLLNGQNFDFDIGFDYLNSITVTDTGANKSKLTFHYTRNNEILMPNETLIIDPTFTDTTSSQGRITSDTQLGVNCDTVVATRDTIFQMAKDDSDNTERCNVSWVEFDISSATTDWTVSSVTLEYDVTTANLATACTWREATVQPSVGALQTLYDDARSGTPLGASDTACTTVANGKIFTFNATGIASVQDAIDASQSWYGVMGFYTDQLRVPTGNTQTVFRSNDAILSITYTTASPPDAVDDLTYTNLSTNTLDLLWTQPNLNGETLQAYTINYTTPWGTPSTFLANTTNTYYNVTGLAFGTDYSFRVSAATVGGYNTTGATILNVTTSSNSYATPPTLTAFGRSGTPSQIDLEFPSSTMQNINGYRIQRETPINTGWVTIVSNTTSATQYYNNTGLTSNIIYNYRVYAMNSSGISTASNTYAMTTFHLPDAVTDLTGTATDLSTIDLSWSAPTSYAPAITGYMINGTTPTGEPVDILNSNTGTTATTATALNLLIGQEYSFRVSPITVHGKNASGNIWNGSTIQTFVIGNLSNPDITNDDDFAIFFERTDVNASAIQLDVTYPNSYNLSCDFSFKYARTNQTYSSLTTVPDGADDQTATFTLINATGDLVQVTCWDVITGDESTYVITITDFPFLEQVRSLRNGDYGTYFQIGAFDGVMLIIIFLGMVGLNRTTPIVGIIFVVITTLTMSYFELITYPIIMYPALIMMIVWAFVTTRKDD